MSDGVGHEVDFHVIVLDDQGNGICGPPERGESYPAGALTGVGTIKGHVVRCMLPEFAVKFHTGYALRNVDVQDVAALCERFGIEMPPEIRRLVQP